MQTPPTWLKTTAAILAALAAVTGIMLNSYGKGTPAPTRTAIHSAVAAPPVAGIESHLAEPGDTEARLPRSLAPPAPMPGCRTELNQHNFSVRTAPVREIAAHYTVSANRPGWGDVESVEDFLDLTSTQASAHFIIDAEGHCAYTVPVALKAWTEAGGNSFTVGIEFIGTGAEGQLSAAALTEGARVIVEVAKHFAIPLQLGDVTGCTPRRAGLVDHAMYGACGGGHHDIRPYYGTNVVRRAAEDHQALDPLINAARALARPHVTAAQAHAKACLDHERRIARRHGGWSNVAPIHLRRARACKATLQT